jgi:hypothetical protein
LGLTCLHQCLPQNDPKRKELLLDYRLRGLAEWI